MAEPNKIDARWMRDALVGMALQGSVTRYHLIDVIGEGAQGWVFRASWDDPEGAIVIVKVLRPDGLNETALKRFVREADVLQKLGQQARPNPYIVRFFDHAIAQVTMGEPSQTWQLPFTVMEYVNGTTLLHALYQAAGTGLPVARVRRVLGQVVNALESVHAHKIVHRDLKPSNILLATESGREIAKVTDFGLVKITEPGMQMTAALAGASLGYAPPEQFEAGNERVSPRTDVFSLAALLYEMLACRRAFAPSQEATALEVLMAVISGPRPSLLRSRASLAPELAGREDLLRALDIELVRALHANPDQRHASAAEFWSRIEPLLLTVAPLPTA